MANNNIITEQITAQQIELLNQRLKLYAGIAKKSAGEIVKEQGKVLVKNLIKYTAPRNSSATDEVGISMRKKGEHATTRDVGKAVMPLDPSKFSSAQKFQDRLNLIQKKKDKRALQAIFDNIPKLQQYKVEDFSSDLHTSKRNYNGRLRVKAPQHVITLDTKQEKKYMTNMEGRVGKLKASWLLAANIVELVLPRWISRHMETGWPQRVSRVEATFEGNNPHIFIWNGAHPYKYIADAAQTAVKATFDSLSRRLNYQLKYLQKYI